MLQHYRFDFANSSGTLNVPTASYSWDFTISDWKRRTVTDAPITVSDAKTTLFTQVDTVSTDLGTNNSTGQDISFITSSVEMGTTGQLGGKFDTSSGAYYEYTGHPDATIRSFGITDAPPMFKVRLDNNSSGAGSTSFAHVFVTFNVNNY